MPKVKLDSAFCRTALCESGKKKTDYYCTTNTGLQLEVRASGGKTFYVRYQDSYGDLRQIKIGRYEDVNFEDARKRAKLIRSRAALGEDPGREKTERKATPTYEELAKMHIADAKTYLKRPENLESVINKHLLPKWGKLRLTEVNPRAVAKWLAEKREEGLAPATIEKIRVTFNRSFELAAKWGIPGGQVNPVRGVARRKYNNARERYLSANQAKQLHAAVEASSNPQLKYIVGLLLLTGARKSELLNAQWKDVHLDRQAWYIPDTKTGKPRHVPLSQAAIDLIVKLPKWPNVPWLIPNPKTRKPFDTIKRAWDTARTEAGLDGLRLHDLRHSAASFMINAGIDLYAVGKILGHADHQSTMRYSHLANDTLRAAVEAGAAKLNVDWAASAGR